MIAAKRGRITARAFRGVAGAIQHKLFVGILLTLDLIVLATMLGIFTLGGATDSKLHIYAIVGTFAYTGAVLGYYLVLGFMSRSLKSIEAVEQALDELTRSDQLIAGHRVLPETGESIHLVSAYNRLVKRLEEVQSSQLEFLALAAHELRSPAAAIIGYADLLSCPDYQEDEKQQAIYREVIAREGKHLLQLIDDINCTAKLTSSVKPFNVARLELGHLIEEAVQDLRGCQPRELVFENEVGPVWISGDALRLREALVNLIENGLKYSGEGLPVVVGLRSGDRPGWVAISVMDYGIGIADRDMSKLFTRFGRIQNEQTRNIPGTGLGLYIVREIVKRHHGKVSVQSKLGAGTTFTIDLPIHAGLQN
jgi:signal transduction histidine kinase